MEDINKIGTGFINPGSAPALMHALITYLSIRYLVMYFDYFHSNKHGNIYFRYYLQMDTIDCTLTIYLLIFGIIMINYV